MRLHVFHSGKIKELFIKLHMTGFLILGFLSFCFCQSFDITEKIQAAESIAGGKANPLFLEQLHKIRSENQVHFQQNCSDYSELLRNYGAFYYLQQSPSDHKLSIRYFQDSALVVAKNCKQQEYAFLVQIMMNLASSNKKIADPVAEKKAIEMLMNSLDETDAKNDSMNAKVYYHIGKYFNENKNFDQAQLWLEKSMVYYNRKKDIGELELRAIVNYASLMADMGKYDKAISLFLLVRTNAEKNEELALKAKYNEILFLNLGETYENNGDTKNAKFYYDKALEISLKNQNKNALAGAYEKLSLLANNDKDYQKAITLIEKSIAISRAENKGVTKQRLAYFLNWLGSYYFELGNYETAKKAYAEAMSLSSIGFNFDDKQYNFSSALITQDVTFVEASIGYFSALTNLSNEKNAEEILKYWDNLDLKIFEIHEDLKGNQEKTYYADLHHKLCGHLLNYLFSNDLYDSFPVISTYAISTSKSLMLFENLVDKYSIPEKFRSDYLALKAQKSTLLKTVLIAEKRNNQNQMDSIFQENYLLNKKLVKLEAEMKADGYTTEFRKLREDIVISAQNKLDSKSALIDYFYDESFIYRLVITNNSLNFKRFKKPEILDENFKLCFYSLTTEKLAQLEKFIEDISPLINDLGLKEEITHLIIIPDNELLFVPFEILMIDGKQVLEKYSCHYQYSIQINQIDFKKSTSKYPYVGFGIEYDEKIRKSIFSSNDIKQIFLDSFNLSALPYAISEINAGNSLMKGKKFINQQSGTSNFKKYVESGQILHIANHVLLNEADSYLTSIVLQNNEHYELVNLLDIQKMNLSADLTILSACNSGMGQNFSGIGLRSLGQSFTQAGCPAVVVNLWESTDKSAEQIISQFLNYIKQGMNKSDALRQAKLDYLGSVSSSLKHPRYWANIVLIGDDEAIVLKKSWSIQNIIFTVLSVLLVIFGYTWYKKRATK